ncbi:MAG: hypothetical protein MUF82_05305, partial [Bacteroidetes bacterium]|nr:hypothetical protein [Bacteroidota bacterium]
MRSLLALISFLGILLLVPGCYILETLGLYTPPPTVADQVRLLRSDVASRQFRFEMFPSVRIDSVLV